jgi:hypothetical protein
MTYAIKDSAPEPSGSLRPQAWWQWVLMYPALGLAVLSAIPTWIDFFQAISIGVPYSDVAYARKQHELFLNNLDCLKKDGNSITLRDNTDVRAAVCDTGAIWIKVTTANDQKGFEWINPANQKQTSWHCFERGIRTVVANSAVGRIPRNVRIQRPVG